MPRRPRRPVSRNAVRSQLEHNRIRRAAEVVVRNMATYKGTPPRELVQRNIDREIRGRKALTQIRHQEREDRKLRHAPEQLLDKESRVLLSGFAHTEADRKAWRKSLKRTPAQKRIAARRQDFIISEKARGKTTPYRAARTPEKGFVSYEEVRRGPANRKILQDALGRKKTRKKATKKR